MRAMSGVGVAAGVGVIWFLSTRGSWRWAVSVLASVAAISLAFVVQVGLMNVLNSGRSEATGLSVDQLPKAHGTWHPLYLGLAFPQQAASGQSPFGISWSDEFGWNKAREVNPNVLIASTEYDQIMKDLYLDQMRAKPATALRLYLEKFLFTVKHFGAMLIFILVGFSMAMWRRGPHRGALGATLALCAPTLALALIPPVLVMPLLYYYSEMSAALGLLVVVSLGALVWVITSMPAQVRADERRRLSGRRSGEAAENPAHGLTVVIPSRNGEQALPGTLDRLGTALSDRDEIIVVENGSTDATLDLVKGIADRWSHTCRLVVAQSEPGLGNALRTGVMASRGARLLLSADDLPFGMTDLERFRQLPDDVVVSVGSKAHPDSAVPRTRGRELQSRIFRFLRSALLQSEVGDSQGTLWVDGVWGRNFAELSHEHGLMWTTELILAAEQQALTVIEVPVTLDGSHETGESRFRLRDGLLAVIGFIRLAVYKDDYVGERWVVPTSMAMVGTRT